MERFLVATIRDNNGHVDYYQFDEEYEIEYFLSCHEDYELINVKLGGEK